MIGFGLGSSFGAFSPLSISGCVEWLKADSLSLSDSDPVSSWTDSSGNSNTATATLTSRPLYRTGIINSLPVLRFDGVNDFMTITRNAGLEPTVATWFAVIRADASPGNFKYFLSKKHTVQDSASYGFNTGGTGLSRALAIAATTGNVFSAGVDVFNTSAHILCGRADASTLKYHVNGYLHSSVTAVGNLTYDSNDFVIGAFDSTQLYAAFDLAELIIYNTALSDVNRWKVQGYLGDKWGVP